MTVHWIKALGIVALALVGMMSPQAAQAQQLCNVSVAPVAFGNYSTTASSPTDAVGAITVGCQATVSLFISFSIALSSGSSGNAMARYMTSGADTLSYELYTSSARTQVWGDGGNGTGQINSGYLLQALVTLAQNYPVYGRIFARQRSVPGSYTDSILITITY